MQDLVNQINRSLSIKEALLNTVENEEQLLKLITLYVQELINQDFQKLLNTLYTLDVGEKKVKKAIENNNLKDSASVIAELILEREKEKVLSRKKYGSGDKGASWEV